MDSLDSIKLDCFTEPFSYFSLFPVVLDFQSIKKNIHADFPDDHSYQVIIPSFLWFLGRTYL